MGKYCPKCDKDRPTVIDLGGYEANFCTECGLEMVEVPLAPKCPKCGKKIMSRYKFCGNCGEKLV